MKWCWAVSGAYLHSRISLDGDGYVGWGVNTRPLMRGADAVIGAEDAVLRYKLASHSIQELPGRNQDLLNESVMRGGGKTTIEFSRRLAASADGIEILPSGANIFVVAAGRSHSLRMHLRRNAASLEVDLTDGDARIRYAGDLMGVHGVLMGLAWMVCAPAAIVVSAFRPSFLGKSWWKAHAALAAAAVALSLAGLAVAAVDVGGIRIKGMHSRTGIVVILLGVVNLASGALRPRSGKDGAKRSVLRVVWEYLHPAKGYAAVVLGHITALGGMRMHGAEEKAPLVYLSLAVFLAVAALSRASRHVRHRRAQERSAIVVDMGVNAAQEEL